MILDLRPYEEFPVEVTLTAEAGHIEPLRDDVRSVGAATVELTIQKSGDEYFCQGTVQAPIELECARCLVPYTCGLEGSTNFIVTTREVREQQADEAVDEEEYVLVDGNELRADLTEIVRETLILELPMKPICREECRGLCSQCGANLNEEECDCDAEKIDPRWEGLKALLDRGSEKGNE